MEDQVMMNIIHKNYLKQRKAMNRKQCKLTFGDKLVIYATALVFFASLLLLMSVVERMKF